MKDERWEEYGKQRKLFLPKPTHVLSQSDITNPRGSNTFMSHCSILSTAAPETRCIITWTKTDLTSSQPPEVNIKQDISGLLTTAQNNGHTYSHAHKLLLYGTGKGDGIFTNDSNQDYYYYFLKSPISVVIRQHLILCIHQYELFLILSVFFSHWKLNESLDAVSPK